ncbi:MAG: recombinase family protein [Planktomarina sp.]
MLIGYARTSTADQMVGFTALLETLKQLGCERVFQKQVSSVADRDQLEAALDFAQDGDTLVVTKIDRLASSTHHLLETVAKLEDQKVALRILDFGGSVVDTKSATGKPMLTMFSAMAQFEREMTPERQREVI